MTRKEIREPATRKAQELAQERHARIHNGRVEQEERKLVKDYIGEIEGHLADVARGAESNARAQQVPTRYEERKGLEP